jgi:hypothetical protein
MFRASPNPDGIPLLFANHQSLPPPASSLPLITTLPPQSHSPLLPRHYLRRRLRSGASAAAGSSCGTLVRYKYLLAAYSALKLSPPATSCSVPRYKYQVRIAGVVPT